MNGNNGRPPQLDLSSTDDAAFGGWLRKTPRSVAESPFHPSPCGNDAALNVYQSDGRPSSLDQLMGPIDSSGHYAGTTPPQTVTNSAGEMECKAFEMPGVDDPDSAAEQEGGGGCPSGSVDHSIDVVPPLPPLGRHGNMSTNGFSPGLFTQNGNVADIWQGVAAPLVASLECSTAGTASAAADVRPADHHDSRGPTSLARPNESKASGPVASLQSVHASSGSFKKSEACGKSSEPRGWSDRWREKFEVLKTYKDEYGHCNVPQKLKYGPDDVTLGSWVNKQRMEKARRDQGKSSTMNDERRRCLESIGFKWAKGRDDVWNERYQQLVDWKAEHGHSNYPTRGSDNPALGRWVTSQRENGKNGVIDEEKKRKLTDLGFVWCRYAKPSSSEWKE